MSPAMVLFAGAILISGCATRGPPPPADVELAQGRALAQRICAACHALGPGEDSADPRAPPFPSREMQHTAGLAGRVAELARGGHYSMPPVSLTAAEAAAVTAYIESLGEPSRDGRHH
jgi:mono/diheme cytochrome c family protein